MRLTIIGATGSMSGPQGAASCYLVQADGVGEDGQIRTYSLVLDMGPGSFGALWQVVDPASLDAVCFSHLHADHCADVISLQVFRKWHPFSQMEKLLVAGPADVEHRIHQIEGDDKSDYSSIFDFQILRPGQSFQVGPMTVTPYPGRHTVEAYGVRVSGPGRDGRPVTLAYSGDTDTCDSIQEMAEGVDLFLCEAGFSDDNDEYERGIHLTGSRAGEIAQKAQVGRLVLTHLQPWYDPVRVAGHARTTFSGDLEIARPGAIYEL